MAAGKGGSKHRRQHQHPHPITFSSYMTLITAEAEVREIWQGGGKFLRRRVKVGAEDAQLIASLLLFGVGSLIFGSLSF